MRHQATDWVNGRAKPGELTELGELGTGELSESENELRTGMLTELKEELEPETLTESKDELKQ